MLSAEKLNKVIAKCYAETYGRAALILPELVSKMSIYVIKQWVLSLRMLTQSVARE